MSYEIEDIISIYTNGSQVLKMLGTFWSKIYSDRVAIREMYGCNNLEWNKLYNRLQELENDLSFTTFDVYHTERFGLFTFSTKDKTTPDQDYFWRYGESLKYGGGGIYGLKRGELSQYPIDSTVVSINMLVPVLDDPEFILYNNLDFSISDGNIIFFTDPLKQSGITISSINGYDEFRLWAIEVKYNLNDLSRKKGYYYGISGDSKDYLELLQAISSMSIGESSVAMTKQILAASAGIELAQGTETVKNIDSNTERLIIETDKHIYLYPADTTPIVTVEQTVHQYDELVDTVRVHEALTIPTTLSVLILDTNMWSQDFVGALGFPNQTVNLTYNGVSDYGYPSYRFTVYGYDEDVEKFWRYVEKNADTFGTLFSKLQNYTENTHSVNPAEVVYSCLSSNSFIIEVKPSQFTSDAPGLNGIRNLESLIPKHTMYFILIYQAISTDIKTGTVDSDVQINLEDQVTDTKYGSLDIGGLIS